MRGRGEEKRTKGIPWSISRRPPVDGGALPSIDALASRGSSEECTAWLVHVGGAKGYCNASARLVRVIAAHSTSVPCSNLYLGAIPVALRGTIRLHIFIAQSVCYTTVKQSLKLKHRLGGRAESSESRQAPVSPENKKSPHEKKTHSHAPTCSTFAHATAPRQFPPQKSISEAIVPVLRPRAPHTCPFWRRRKPPRRNSSCHKHPQNNSPPNERSLTITLSTRSPSPSTPS